jgi:acetyl esterase/lipase
MDILIPSKLANLGRNGETWRDWAEAVVVSLLHLLTAYPRALWAWFRPPRNARHEEAKAFRPVVFIHGGGFCAVDPSIQHHQLTAFCRAGFAVYSIAYPWAPESPFPAQLVSTLRALSWIHRHHGHLDVQLIGESAGGNLVMSAAGLLSNPKALQEFAARCDQMYCGVDDVAHWRYPGIESVTSWYGILDTQSWKGRGILAWGLQWTVDAWIEDSPFPRCLSDVEPRAVWGARALDPCLTIVDTIRAGVIDTFPRTLLVSGRTDPLGLYHSSKLAFEVLAAKRFDVRHVSYGAGHAFIGLNPFVLVFLHGSKWRTHLAKPATALCVAFLRGQSVVSSDE